MDLCSIGNRFHGSGEVTTRAAVGAEGPRRSFRARVAIGRRSLLAPRARAVKRVEISHRTKLAELAESTQEERSAAGFTPNEPLLRDGSFLRAGVEKEHAAAEAGIGSAEIVQFYHEYGYDNARTGTYVPDRPVFKTALDESEKDVIAILEDASGAALGMRLP